MRGPFRTRLFAATFSVAAVVLVLAALLIASALRRTTFERIERGLVGQTRLAAELLSHRGTEPSRTDLQAEALVLARDIDARVTLIAPDGRVVGDSSVDAPGLAQLENHLTRPEVVAAAREGLGESQRFSDTLGADLLYVAAAVRHPAIATVRLALPLTEIERQLRAIWRVTFYALVLCVAGAFGLAWGVSALLVRRLDRLADGARRYAAGGAVEPLTDYADDEIGTVARVLDDVVRRLGERAADLARDRAEMEAILSGMIEGVLVLDGEQRVRLVNDVARRLLRIDSDIAGHHYLECVRHPVVVAELEGAVRRGGAVQGPRAIVHEDGRVFVARATAVSNDGRHGAVLVLHDITDLHRADQIRRDFVGNVSHELRTPLTAIRGYVEALRDEPIDEPTRQRFLEIIARHTERMERLTRDLLRLARIEAGQEPPAYASTPLAPLFEALLDDARRVMAAKGQKAEVVIDTAVAEVETDPQQLHDALRNLIENAALYTPADGRIRLLAREVRGHLVIEVEDDGPGVPEADLARVFERFYRVDRARARDSGGTGIGLAIVKHIVEGMHGTVRAANRPQGGARFTITLPLR